MPLKRIIWCLVAGWLVLAVSVPVQAQDYHYRHIAFSQTIVKDLVKLLPRSMGYYIYQNQDDFMRGLTFMTRQIWVSPFKNKDIEEIRREAYERLMRDIPYCIEAFKGGEIKLDTTPSNLSGRLGMIAFSIIMRKIPDLPDLEYLERTMRSFEEAVADNLFDLWVYYDGYGDFHSLGELMERLRNADTMPELRRVRNAAYPVYMKQDPFAMFRPPSKHERKIVLTDTDYNNMYNDMINGLVDAYLYIWKCSGMDLAHPSFMPPPGTIISRKSTRRQILGGTLTRTVRGFGSATPGPPGPGAKAIREYGFQEPESPAAAAEHAPPKGDESTITSVQNGPKRLQWGGAGKKRSAGPTGLQPRRSAANLQ
ncbi:MAG: hypothetical protein AB1646_16385 [Thermodesulfobacteriota bacterium]